MQKQFNVSLCLKELHLSIKSLILEGSLHSLLLNKFSQEEINACLPGQIASFLQGFEGPAASEAHNFCEDFCEDLVVNQQADCEDMIRLKRQIVNFQKKYEESRTNITRKTVYACTNCNVRYSTENGLHNHLTKTDCRPKRKMEEGSIKKRKGQGKWGKTKRGPEVKKEQ